MANARGIGEADGGLRPARWEEAMGICRSPKRQGSSRASSDRRRVAVEDAKLLQWGLRRTRRAARKRVRGRGKKKARRSGAKIGEREKEERKKGGRCCWTWIATTDGLVRTRLPPRPCPFIPSYTHIQFAPCHAPLAARLIRTGAVMSHAGDAAASSRTPVRGSLPLAPISFPATSLVATSSAFPSSARAHSLLTPTSSSARYCCYPCCDHSPLPLSPPPASLSLRPPTFPRAPPPGDLLVPPSVPPLCTHTHPLPGTLASSLLELSL